MKIQSHWQGNVDTMCINYKCNQLIKLKKKKKNQLANLKWLILDGKVRDM